MDKNLLKLFRKTLGLNSEELPDSISTKDFGKLIEKSAGKLFVKPEDLKNLQKSLSLKDVELKKALAKTKQDDDNDGKKTSNSDEKITNLESIVGKLTETIQALNSENEIQRLSKNYPDILPDFLIGKTPEQIENIVDKQRLMNKKLYGDSAKFTSANYTSQEEIDKVKSDIKDDTSKNGETSAVKILQLNRQSQSFQNE